MFDVILFQKVRDMVPESQAYMDLLSFEKRLDTTIARKRLEIQEAVKRPLKVIFTVHSPVLYSTCTNI